MTKNSNPQPSARRRRAALAVGGLSLLGVGAVTTLTAPPASAEYTCPTWRCGFNHVEGLVEDF